MTSCQTILKKADIDRMIKRIGYEILERHKGSGNLALIGIQTRGVYIAKRLQATLLEIEGSEIPTGDMDITLYRDDWTMISAQPVVQATDIQFPVDDKQIILVDDVLFTGRTIRAAMDAVVDFGRPGRGWDFRSLGRGGIDFEEIIRGLNRAGYDGPLSVEWEDSGMDREHGAAESAAFVRDADFVPSGVAFDAAFDEK